MSTDKSVFDQTQAATVTRDEAPSGLEQWTNDRGFFGHPRGLSTLFFTEMWERFGYYLMIAIFTLYLNEHLNMSEADAASLYGLYIALVYLSPLFGGVLADRVLGYRR